MTTRPLLLAVAIAAATLPAAGALAAGGSFSCERMSTAEVRERLNGGSSALHRIVGQYLARWDAKDARRQCEAYAAGRPYDISCPSKRRDWDEILASVPSGYFGQSNKSLAATYRAEMNAGNGYREAMAYCRSVGAIR